VTGHVLGVVSAHDRAVALFPRRSAVAGQIPCRWWWSVTPLAGCCCCSRP